jgi:alpha-tubulin suppressor-like RCC1 family protein
MIRWTRSLALQRTFKPILVAGVVCAGVACRDDAIQGPALPDETPAAAPELAATAAPLAFRQVTVNFFHSCGVTAGNQAYCWGDNTSRELGDGTTTERHRPKLVTGGFAFRQTSAGSNHTCAVTTGDRAYCWGENSAGQLGNGTTANRATPVAVTGGLRFQRLSSGATHTCGVTLENRVYCWGGNFAGQLGDGTTVNRLVPTHVAGGHRFGQVSASGLHTCAVTPASVLFCWGRNEDGELGDGTTTDRKSPVRVLAGTLQFRQVSAGASYTCAVTLNDVAYCWGRNGDGRLGNGTFNQPALTPSKVRGGIHFRTVTTGLSHACGITPDDVPYCWGDWMFIGSGATTDQRTPVPVSGGLHARQMEARIQHTCLVTTASRAFCWGLNADGQIGDGTTSFRLQPTPVLNP